MTSVQNTPLQSVRFHCAFSIFQTSDQNKCKCIQVRSEFFRTNDSDIEWNLLRFHWKSINFLQKRYLNKNTVLKKALSVDQTFWEGIISIRTSQMFILGKSRQSFQQNIITLHCHRAFSLSLKFKSISNRLPTN